MPQNCDMGPTVLLPLRRKACWGFFRWLRSGLNPRTWVPEASMLTTTPNALTWLAASTSRQSSTQRQAINPTLDLHTGMDRPNFLPRTRGSSKGSKHSPSHFWSTNNLRNCGILSRKASKIQARLPFVTKKHTPKSYACPSVHAMFHIHPYHATDSYKTVCQNYIYLTAIGLTHGGSSTSHIYTQTVHILQRKENWEVRAVPRLCELYPGICLTTEEKPRKPLTYTDMAVVQISVVETTLATLYTES
jgi:hypothetical protein